MHGSPVGFDLEWRVIFSKNAPMRPVATVQLSDRNMILVIQLSSMKCESCVLHQLIFLTTQLQLFRPD